MVCPLVFKVTAVGTGPLQHKGYVLQEIYKTGNAIKRIKNINSANAIVYLLDSTFAKPCM